GFENLEDLVHLNLSSNKFEFQNGEKDLVTRLWNRLPKKVDVLILSYNSLGELPCELSKREILRLQVDKCELRHICPRIGSTPFPRSTHNFVSIKLNDQLKNLSFVPTKIYFPPTVKDEKQKQPNEVKGRMILISDRSFKDTSRWQTSYKIHTYDFIPKYHHEEKLHGCNCCARCGINCAKEIGEIETFMVMDFTHIVETPSNETRAEKEVIVEYGPGEWKTMIKTKMCFKCLAKMRTEVAEFYNDMPLKHKTNARKNKNIEPPNASTDVPQSGVQPSALIPVMDSKCDNSIFNTSKIQEITSHLHQQHYQHDITMASFPPQLSEQYVQMDNTNIMYIHPLDTVNP
uniref:Uncharacterized protein n=1 Tax=Panagrolaimus sp. ES5 TaxID=591445 RepID=A0AC34GBK1_9BILA